MPICLEWFLSRAAACLIASLLYQPGVCIAATDAAEAADARGALAERLAELAENTLRVGSLTEPAFRQSAALLEGASRENPVEPRFPRLLVSAESELQNLDGQIAAWSAYRKLVPDDRDAQQQLIDLYASKMETADAKLQYLQSLLDKTHIPDEVRAHVGAECVGLLLDRSREAAIAMVAKAKSLYPLPEVLSWEYELVGQRAPALERVRSLLAVIRSDPAQPKRMAELAQLLATNEHPEAALEWYARAITLDNRSGQAPSHSLAVDYVAELFIANEMQAAETAVGHLLQMIPDDPDFWFLKLSVMRAANEQVALSQTLGLAKDAFVRRLALANEQVLSNGKAPTTLPAIVAAPDLSAALESLKTKDRPEVRNTLVWALNNLAWFELYYDQQPDAAASAMNALKALLPEDDVTLKRLLGWQALAAGHAKEASEIFAPLAEEDPLSALGLVRLEIQDEKAPEKPQVQQLKAKLLDENRTGLLGAVIREGLGVHAAPATQPSAPATEPKQSTTRPGELAPLTVASGAAPASQPTSAPSTTAASDPITAELNKLPRDVFEVIDQPSRAYSIRVEPLRTSVRFGEPLFARVTLKNVGNYDIFVGPAGVLQTHLWFNAQSQGIITQTFPGVVYDRIANVTVLRPKASTSQIIRLDQGDLGEAMLQRPNGSIIVSGSVVTNPLTLGGTVALGPAGYSVQFARNFVRPPMDLRSPDTLKRVTDELANGDPAQKMRDLDLVAAYVRALSKEMDQSARATAQEYLQDVAKLRNDPVLQVGAWAQYLVTTLPGVQGQQPMIREMLGSKEWEVRLLGLAASRLQNADVRTALLGDLAGSEADPSVKRLATAIVDQLKQPATKPTSQPVDATGGPATQPRGPALAPR